MALQEPYVTVLEADALLVDSVIWGAATESEKEQALFWGRIWIDTNYTCPNLPDNPSDEVKYANALLGEDYLEGTLLNTETGGTATGVKRLKQKAGSVEKETEYFEGGSNSDATNYQADVTAMLDLECTKTSSGGGTVDLVRD